MAQARAVPTAEPIAFNRFLALVYLVMTAGLAVTALVSTSVSANPEMTRRILYNPWFAFGLFILQIFIVVAISAAVLRLSPGVALLLFLLLALMGWTFGLFLTWIFPFAQGFNQLMNFSGILLFAGLAVWDTQRRQSMCHCERFVRSNLNTGLSNRLLRQRPPHDDSRRT